MCRNIKTLYNFEPPATRDEIEAASRQYVRKISGFSAPSVANQAAFASARLLDSLVTAAPHRDRDVEAAKAHERALRRFAAS